MNTPTNPIRPILIGRQWHVTNDDTGEVWGPFDSSWSAIAKTQELRSGKTAQAATEATKKTSYRYER